MPPLFGIDGIRWAPQQRQFLRAKIKLYGYWFGLVESEAPILGKKASSRILLFTAAPVPSLSVGTLQLLLGNPWHLIRTIFQSTSIWMPKVLSIKPWPLPSIWWILPCICKCRLPLSCSSTFRSFWSNNLAICHFPIRVWDSPLLHISNSTPTGSYCWRCQSWILSFLAFPVMEAKLSLSVHQSSPLIQCLTHKWFLRRSMLLSLWSTSLA